MNVMRGQRIAFLICLLTTAVAMVLFVRVCHRAPVFTSEAIGLTLAGAILLTVITSPVPIVVMIFGRRRSYLWAGAFLLWIVLCIALGLWAAFSPI